ncbi:MAG: arginine--tRNA ligase [Thermoleophilia bacterium]|nr:arginine--tRNA ligase [Thermoleophilia bacterium]
MTTALERLEHVLGEDAGAAVTLERPRDPAHGDYATNVALRTAPARGRPPMDLAQELAAAATRVPAVQRAEAAPPGFLNLVMQPAWFGGAVEEILDRGASYGAGTPSSRQRIQVELVSANPTGPLTVASARNAAYGDSVARLFEFAGHEVEREFYVNDVGEQIDRFRASVAARARGLEPPPDGYHGAYLAEVAGQGGDAVETMLSRIRATLERFRVAIGSWVRQSEIERELDAALAELPLYEFEGARWVPTTRWGDDKDRVVVRSDGRTTYFAADVAYLRHKLGRGYDRLVYVLGADHHGYVSRLRAATSALGHDPDAVEVLIYQLVHLVQGGEARKLSKRRGDVVFLDELLDEVGVDAARWFLVSRGHDQAVEIDVDLARERSEKNPVYYVQYAHARIAGILRNAGDRRLAPDAPVLFAPEERDLVKRLLDFPATAAEATHRRAPHAIPAYAIRLADDFHRFYHHHRVLESEEEAFRLALCRATQTVVARCLDLVGVEAPERM